MANEGDDRDDFIEGEESIRLAKWKVELDGKKFPNAQKLVSKQWLGRLKTPKINELNGDADGDGDQDLFVVSGGNAFSKGSKRYENRLYLNMGKGQYLRSPLDPRSRVPAGKSTEGPIR